MGSPSEKSYRGELVDEVYPDGDAWRCSRPDCAFTCGDDGPDWCPEHNLPVWRCVRRLTGPGFSRDVVTQSRGQDWTTDVPDA